MDIDAMIAAELPAANAQTETKPEPIEPVIEQTTEPTAEPEPQEEQPWPKKAENALAKEKGRTARLKFERDQERQARQQLEEKLAQYNKPTETKSPTGEPQINDYTQYHEYIRALNKWDNAQTEASRDAKQKESEAVIGKQAWEDQRSERADEQMETFSKEVPDAHALYDEHKDTIKELPNEIKHAILAADNVPLALYNLAKEGKLDDLGAMSLVDAKVEIRLAQLKQPAKPQTKAPAPLPGSRGSVAGSKNPTDMSPEEALQWYKS